MKKITILLLSLCLCTAAHAQMSRKAMEQTANEAVSQIALTGHTPKAELIEKLASNADMSIDMLSRMGDPNDARQSRACVRLIDDITAYSLTDKGRRYVNLVRNGLKKAIDRSDSSESRLHYLDQLKTVAKPADASHIVMYLTDQDMAPEAFRLLVAMPDIDNELADIAKSTAKPDENIEKIMKARKGLAVAAPKEKARPKPSALPFWTVSLDKEVERIASTADRSADDIMLKQPAAQAMPALLAIAAQKEGGERDAIIARYVTMAEGCGATDGERYLLLRRADELNPCQALRQKIVVDLGNTHTIQALAYIRQYYDKRDLADAVAVSTRNIIAQAPQANGGRYVYNMLQAAKQSFIRHYDEQGVDMAIDDVLAAIDDCGTSGGYNLAFAPPTRMGKRGYWNMSDELKDFDLTFDWLADGIFTVSLHSMPVLSLDHKLGVRLAGDDKWHPFGGDDKSYPRGEETDWCTVNISVTDNMLTLSVNGRDLFVNTPLVSEQQGQPANTSGTIRFLADDNGATVRQVCIRRR